MNVGKNKQGFTIVELLIVVVVIAILAAITVVAYNGIQNQTHDSVVQADMKNIGTIFASVHAETGSYPVPTSDIAVAPSGISKVKLSLNSYDDTKHNFYYCVTPENDRFTLSARSKSGKTWVYYSNAGVREHTGSWTTSASICSQTLEVPSSSENYLFSYGRSSAGTNWYAWVR